MTMLPHNLIWEMWTCYEGGMSIGEVSRAFDRSRHVLRDAFKLRGLKVRPPPGMPKLDPKTGCFLPVKPHTAAEITKIIAGMGRICTPPALKVEWRSWPMARRVEFVERVRATLNDPNDRPTTPFSRNVTPWQYGSACAMDLAYDGPSQKAGCKLKLCSQGVIWRGTLYYWGGAKTGYVEGVPWTPQYGRPMLHHEVWAHHNGRPVPAKHQVIFLDGNVNNFDPKNLALRSKADCCWTNRKKHYDAQGREATALLLRQSQKKEANANHKLTKALRLGGSR